MGLPPPALYAVDEHSFFLKTDNGLELTFVETPYCHAPGAFVTYFRRGRILFSGDLFGSIDTTHQLYADESCFDDIEAFHQRYMPSRDILNHALKKIERYETDVIAPQHGAVIRKPLIQPLIERLKQLECGLHTKTLYRLNLLQTTDKLKEETLKNELILEASPNAVIAIDATQRIIVFNRTAEAMFGYTKEEMLGKNALDKIIPPELLEAHRKGLQRFLSCRTCDNVKPRILEYEALRKNGRRFPIRINFGAHREAKRTVIVATIQDISEEKVRNEISRRQMHMAQLGEMLGMIAHQWRQPLSAISISNHILAKKAIDAKEQFIDTQTVLSFTTKIAQYSEFLNHTVEDFRQFFKPDNRPSPTNTQLILDIVLPIVHSQLLSRGIELLTYIDDRETFISYGGELKQVVLNLIKNAIDAFEDHPTDKPTITIHTYNAQGYHSISVEDNAGGIKEDVMEKIFDLFFTTKGTNRGTGLGLYMSKIIVEEHCKGTLSVENTPDGARFTIAVPSLL